MQKEKVNSLKDHLKESVKSSKESNDVDRNPSWRKEQGVLISYREAEFVAGLLNKLSK